MHRDAARSCLNQGLDDPGLPEIASIHSLRDCSLVCLQVCLCYTLIAAEALVWSHSMQQHYFWAYYRKNLKAFAMFSNYKVQVSMTDLFACLSFYKHTLLKFREHPVLYARVQRLSQLWHWLVFLLLRAKIIKLLSTLIEFNVENLLIFFLEYSSLLRSAVTKEIKRPRFSSEIHFSPPRDSSRRVRESFMFLSPGWACL